MFYSIATNFIGILLYWFKLASLAVKTSVKLNRI